jgi:hypothetical protein
MICPKCGEEFDDEDIFDAEYIEDEYLNNPNIFDDDKVWYSLRNFPEGTQLALWKIYLEAVNKDFYIPEEPTTI